MKQHFLLKTVVVLASLLLATVGLYAQDNQDYSNKPWATDLSCDGKGSAPDNVSTYTPMFSWIFHDYDFGDGQTACTIQVGTAEDGYDMWNHTENLATSTLMYGGRPLAANTWYYWSVQVWDKFPQANDIIAKAKFMVLDIGLRASEDGTSVIRIAVDKVNNAYPLHIAKDGNIYSIITVDPFDHGASKLRIQTAPGVNGTKALKKMVAPPPAIGLDLGPEYLIFRAVASGAIPAEQTVSISNAGGGTLDWSTLTASVSSGWLSLDRTAPATLTVRPTTGTLDTGTSTATITVASSTAGVNSQTVGVTFVDQVSTPTFSPVAGTYSSAQTVTIMTVTPGASIRYTTDGSTPTRTVGTLYSGPINVAVSEALHAIAYEPGWSDSAVAAAAYTLRVAAPTFSPPAGTYYSAQSVTISTTTPGASIRYTTDGSTPTRTYGTLYAGQVTVAVSETLYAIAYESGRSDSNSSAAYTILSPGTLDTTFAADYGANRNVWSVAAQRDGKVLIVGDFTAYNGISRGHVARLNSDASLDTGFLATGAGANGFVRSVAVQSDGKILICGTFTTYNGTNRPGLARLNIDGSLDTDFLATGAGADGQVYSVTVQSDGKVLIVGSFTAYNGTRRGRVARLNIDGSLDTGFLATGAGANDSVSSVAVRSDGKILIGGFFWFYNDTLRPFAIARLNSDGSLDTSFLGTGEGGNGGVLSVAVQGDGKVLIGGMFTDYKGTSRGRVARLNIDGSLDTAFATGAGANDLVESVVLQSDGKVLIGGSFTTYNGTSRGGVARLNSDGSLDTDFLATGAGVNGGVLSVAVQSDGKILIGGWFSIYNGTSRGGVARLWN